MNNCLTAPLKEPEALSQMQPCPRLFLTKHGDLGRGSSLPKFRHGTLTMEALINSRPLIQGRRVHRGCKYKSGISTKAAEFPFICFPPLSCAETATHGTEANEYDSHPLPFCTKVMNCFTVWSKLTPWYTKGLKFRCSKERTRRTVTVEFSADMRINSE